MTPNTHVDREWTAALSAAAVVAVLAIPAAAGHQQQTPAEVRPVFEAATIKLAAPNVPPSTRPIPSSPNRLSIPSMTLNWLIYTAYGDGGFNTAMRVTGGPDWANKTAFAVEGVASSNATPRQRRLMLQTLLEDRFALKVRITETQTADVNTLVMDRADGKLGTKV